MIGTRDYWFSIYLRFKRQNDMHLQVKTNKLLNITEKIV